MAETGDPDMIWQGAWRVIAFFCALLTLSACAALSQHGPPAMPSLGFRYLEQAVDDNFDTGERWRQYEADAELFMGSRDGSYLLDFPGKQYVWAQRDGSFADVVIEAEARQLSTEDHNAYGLACRLDHGNRGRGYFFLIGGDGYASIRWSNGRSLEAIVSARPAGSIKRGQSSNRLRAVCIGDYLALWVNGEFVMEARDQRAATGGLGLAGMMSYSGKRLTVAFDDFQAWRGALDA